MLENLKQNIPLIEIILGYVIYILLLVKTSFPLAVLWIMFIIYLWLLSSMVLKKYTFNAFLYLLCSSGIAVAISFFFLKGVEELPYPEGALMFHVDGIAKAFFLLFLCTIPMIIKRNTSPDKTMPKTTTPPYQYQNKKESWEEATPEDLKSGDYEPL